ncbi:hypothetical protein AAVH_43675 [Aphelenchoides avenae]|nr:hypothetical protein AAVH_43675 [Aphelenchus avenae]
MRRVREQWRAFKKFFFWHLRDSPTLDLRERFKFLHVYHALEKPGDDPLSVRLQRHMPPHSMITYELLDALCPNCGDFGHGLGECTEKPIDREEMEFLQNEIKTFKKIFEGRLKAGGISLYDFLETASTAEEEKPPFNCTVNEYVPGQSRRNAPYKSNFKLWPDFPLK